MTRTSSCGLLLVSVLASAPVAGAREVTGPQTCDLKMEEALDLARRSAPAVRVARARIAEARGRLVGASALLTHNPELELGGGARVGPVGVTGDVDVGVSQVFELGGQRAAGLDAAKAGIEREIASVEDATRRALRAVAVAFVQARYIEERVGVAAHQVRLVAEVLSVAERRHEAGDVGALDVDLAALALARSQAEARTLGAARERALGELRALLGLGSDAGVVPCGALLEPRRHELGALLASASERGDLRALDASVREAEAEAQQGRAKAWPDLGVRIGYAREEEADIVLGTLSLTLPFFDHGQGLEESARARGGALRVEREAAEQSARAAVRTAFDAYQRLAEAAAEFERRGLPRIARGEELARRSYEAGDMRLGELLAVRRELLAARITHTDLALGVALAGVELEAAAGVLR